MNRLTDHERMLAAINGLANFKTFLEKNPDLPLSVGDNPFHVGASGRTDAEKRADVDRIAHMLGVAPGYMHGGETHYEASRDFGGGVTYSVTAISRSHMDQYLALQSYSGSVQPEMAVAA